MKREKMQLLLAAAGRRRRGFTLIELLAVIAIAAILASFAVPAMGNFVRNARIRGASQELRAVLIRGRSEAITRNTEVRVVPVGADWRNGWTIETTAGVPIEAASAPLRAVVTTPAPAPTVVYGVDGRVHSGAQQIVLSVAGDALIPARCITLRASGMASTRLDTDHDPSNGCN